MKVKNTQKQIKKQNFLEKVDENENDNTDINNEGMNTLKINKEFAKKFDHMKRREELEKAEMKFGKDFFKKKGAEDDDDEDSEDLESEDSNAELVNDRVMEKFIDTMVKLQDDKNVKELLETKEEIFKEEDFKQKRKINDDKKKEKAFTVNDALINYKEDEDEADNFFSVDYKPKISKKEDELKKAFIENAKVNEDDDEEDNDFGFLKKKENQDNNDETEIEVEEDKDLEEMDFQEIAKKKHKVLSINDDNIDLLKKFWGDNKNIDKNERFLRSYILNEAWLDKTQKKKIKLADEVDEEDEENDEKFEEFEEKYNFRFEEEGGANLTTHQRNMETYRQKDDTRKEKRKEREKRKETEHNQVLSELERAKELKKSEILEKIEYLEKVAGTDKVKLLVDNIEDDFEPEKFDELMHKVFDEDYFKNQEFEETIKEVIEEKSFDYKTNKELPTKEKLKKIEEQENEFNEDDNKQKKKNTEEEDQRNENKEQGYDDDQSEDNEWFYCDECKQVINEKKIKYDCKICEDYCLCKSCFKTINHPHQMKKNIVPIGCKPPSNWKELIEGATSICERCSNDLEGPHYFECAECNSKFCRTCRGIGKSIHEHPLKKVLIEQNEEEFKKEQDPKEKLKNLIDVKLSVPKTDLIDGKIPTRFHYTKVGGNDFGLTDEMIYYLDDKTLNKYLPLKKLAPYRGEVYMNEWEKKKALKMLQREVDKQKKFLMSQNEERENIQKSNLNLLNKKRNVTNYEKLDKKEFKKKKRLETYGLTDE